MDNPRAAAARVRAAYAAGVPLFSRDALIEIARVLDADGGAVRRGEMRGEVTLTDLAGHRVTQTTAVGAERPTAAHNDIVLVHVAPCLQYWPRQRLVGTGPWHERHFDRARACLAVRIGHATEARAVVDGGAVVTGPTPGAVAATLARRAAGLPDRPPVVPSDAELTAWFAEQRAQWEASGGCHQLRETLISHPPPPVRSIVALGCGPLTADNAYHRRRAAAQHALLLTLADVLPTTTTPPIIIQDPAYTDTDRRVLAAAGMTAVDDPHGFLAVDASAVVVAVAPAVAVAQVVADLCPEGPAALLWERCPPANDDDDDKDDLYDRGGADNPPSSRVRALLAKYTEHAFEGGPLFGTVRGLRLYVRK